MSVLDDFGTWKGFLAGKLQQAEEQGMSQQTVSSIAFEVGNYLSESVEAENHEEAVLRELWDAGSKEEQQVIANIMVKLVQQEGN